MSKRDFGCEVNFSIVFNNDDGYEIGFHYIDSDDLDIEQQVSAETAEDAFETLLDLVKTSITNADKPQKEETPEERIQRLEEEIESLQLDNTILQNRLNEQRKSFDDRKKNAEMLDYLMDMFHL